MIWWHWLLIWDWTVWISFHVGSQQREIPAWDKAIAQARHLFDWAAEKNIRLRAMNMGGGFPADYLIRCNPLSVYAEEINRYVDLHFADAVPDIYLEPGGVWSVRPGC